MLVRCTELPSGTRIEADVCIIGAGPAGLSVASQLDKSSLTVALLDAGGEPGGPQGMGGMAVTTVDGDFDVPPRATPRFGGAANEWIVRLPWMRRGVRMLPLSEIDLAVREWIPDSGWPIDWAEMEGAYRAAHAHLGLGRWGYDVSSWEDPDHPRYALEEHGFTTAMERFPRPEVFTSDAWKALQRSANVTVYLDAPVGMLQGEPDRVTHAEIDNGARGRLTVVARQFVLAAGGIENPRQILAARHGGGYGTTPDIAGRYYMDHLRFISGILTPHDATTIQRSGLYDIRETTDRAVVMGKLVPTDQLMRDHRLLHSGAMLLPKLPQNLVADVRALMTGARSAVTGNGLPKMSVWRDAFGGAIELTAMAARMAIRQRRLPPRTDAGWSGIGGRGHFTHFAVELQVEQAPIRSNQVRLNGVNALGRPGAELVWRWSQADLDSVRRTQELFASAIGASEIGNFESTPWDEQPPLTTPSGAYHPTGGTRMHPDPNRGVVDADTRVHGVTNLYVTGSSIFPTSGYANPTLTIVALALRTGRHLAALAAASR